MENMMGTTGRVLLLLAAAAAAAAVAVAAAAASTTSITVGAAAAVVRKRKADRQSGGGARKKKRTYSPGVRTERLPPFDLDKFEALLIHLNVGFESYFRLPRRLFDAVLADVRHSLLRAAPEQGVRSSGHNIVPEHRLAVALRFFAGAQWQDIVVAMQPICKTEVYDWWTRSTTSTPASGTTLARGLMQAQGRWPRQRSSTAS
jgi:hypothetical protein